MSDEKKQSKFCESFQESQKLFNLFQNFAKNVYIADGKLVDKIKALNDSFTVFNQNFKDVKDGSVILKSSLCDQLETVKKHLQTILDDVHETRKKKAENLLSLIQQLQKWEPQRALILKNLSEDLHEWMDKKVFLQTGDFYTSNLHNSINHDEQLIIQTDILMCDDINMLRNCGCYIHIASDKSITFDFDK